MRLVYGCNNALRCPSHTFIFNGMLVHISFPLPLCFHVFDLSLCTRTRVASFKTIKEVRLQILNLGLEFHNLLWLCLPKSHFFFRKKETLGAPMRTRNAVLQCMLKCARGPTCSFPCLERACPVVPTLSNVAAAFTFFVTLPLEQLARIHVTSWMSRQVSFNIASCKSRTWGKY